MGLHILKYLYSLFGPKTTKLENKYIYTDYKGRMPQENKTMEKIIKEKIPSNIKISAKQQAPPQKKPEENNTKSIIEYLEKNYNYLRNMRESETKGTKQKKM